MLLLKLSPSIELARDKSFIRLNYLGINGSWRLERLLIRLHYAPHLRLIDEVKDQIKESDKETIYRNFRFEKYITYYCYESRRNFL